MVTHGFPSRYRNWILWVALVKIKIKIKEEKVEHHCFPFVLNKIKHKEAHLSRGI